MASHPKIEVEGLSKWYEIGKVAKPRLQDGITSVLRSLMANRSEETNLHPESRGFWALRDLNFRIAPGERVGIIGANGSGKSSLLKILSRITAPTQGKATLRGKVSSLLEVGAGLHPDISGRENIFLYGSMLGIPRLSIARQFDSIVDFSGLERFIDTPVKKYSTGMYLRLAFAVCAHLEPDILLLDEVMAVGDLNFQQKCREKITQMVENGVTLVFVSHDTAEISRLCQRVLWLSDGKLVADGDPLTVFPHYSGHFGEWDQTA